MEYKFIKPWKEWSVGQSIYPNCHLSGGERRWLVEHGYIIPASQYKAPKPAPAIPRVVQVETAAFEPPPLRRRGRPPKNGYKPEDTVSGTEDSQSEEIIE